MSGYDEQDYNSLYESDDFQGLVEDTLRPGGLELTARNLAASGLAEGSRVLDVGCGCGKTVKFLRDQLNMQACGVDKSAAMIANGKLLDDTLDIRVGDAERLDFAAGSFDAVVAECVFCLLPNKAAALEEFCRVLKPGGKLIMSDLYLLEPSAEPVSLDAVTCLQNLMTEDEIRRLTAAGGFENLHWRNCRDEYVGFLGDLIFGFDSVQGFWQCLLGRCGDSSDNRERLKRKKISYYSAVWQRSTV